MNIVKIKHFVLPLTAFLSCLTGKMEAAVIASANFTGLNASGATSVATSGTPGVNDFTWSRLIGNTFTFSTPSVNMQSGTGNSLRATIDTTSTFQGMTGTMATSTTIAIGQTLTLSFIGQYIETPANNATGLRFGFMNSGSLDNAFGIAVGINGSNSLTINRDVATGGDNSPLGGSSQVALATGTGTQNISTSVYTASFSITRNDTDTYSYFANINGSTLSASNIAGGFDNYNAIVIRNGSPTADFQIDNVSVDLIPEPSTLLLSGLGLMLFLRRRR